MTPIFLSRYREAHKILPSPCWSPSQGYIYDGEALGQITQWIAPSIPDVQLGLWNNPS
jgi:hypothetical protein